MKRLAMLLILGLLILGYIVVLLIYPKEITPVDYCDAILYPSPGRFLVVDHGVAYGEGLNLQPEYNLTFHTLTCNSGSSVGQNISHLYCQPMIQHPFSSSQYLDYPRAERTNIGPGGIIESQECYVLNIKELAPLDEQTTNRNAGYQIVEVTCQPCK